MRLYHHPMSSNARRAVMTALHLRAEVALVSVDLANGAQRTPEFLRMNPNGKVPVLDDEGFYLWESHAIMQYLADKTPKQTIYPTDPKGRADVNRWLFWSAHHFTPAVSVLNWERVVKPMLGRGAPDPKEEARGEQLVTECLRVLNGYLEGKVWLSGGGLTLADLAIVTPLASTVPAKLPVDGHRHVAAWFEKMRGLDAWKKTEDPRS